MGMRLAQTVAELQHVDGLLPTAEQIGAGTDVEVLELARFTAFLVKRIQGVGVACAGVLDRRITDGSLTDGGALGFGGAAQLVRDLTGSSMAEARKRLRLAAAITPGDDGREFGSAPPCELVAAAVEEGQVSEAAAVQIVDTLKRHEELGGAAGKEMESHLIGVAMGVDTSGVDYGAVERQIRDGSLCGALGSGPGRGTDIPGTGREVHLDEVRRACSQASDSWNPRRAVDADRDVTKGRFLVIGRQVEGLVSMRGSLLPEVAAALEAMTNASTSPRARITPEGYGRGRDALVHCDGAGQAGEAPGVTHESDSKDSAFDRRDPGQKRHDAFASILNVAAATAATTASATLGVPILGGAASTVMIQTSREAMEQRRAGVVHTNNGPVSTSGLAVEHAACVGAVQFYSVDPGGALISLGNQQRTFTGHQRRAILARDGGCVIPNCDVPGQWCEVHHVTPHALNGPTHTDNGVLLCYFHHRHIEESGWNVRMKNGVPEVRPPRWKDPDRRWWSTRRVGNTGSDTGSEKSASGIRGTTGSGALLLDPDGGHGHAGEQAPLLL